MSVSLIIELQFVICKNPTYSTIFCQRKFKIEALLGARDQGGGLGKIWNGRKLREEFLRLQLLICKVNQPSTLMITGRKEV
jgi:hypothetical protein